MARARGRLSFVKAARSAACWSSLRSRRARKCSGACSYVRTVSSMNGRLESWPTRLDLRQARASRAIYSARIAMCGAAQTGDSGLQYGWGNTTQSTR